MPENSDFNIKIVLVYTELNTKGKNKTKQKEQNKKKQYIFLK